MGEPSEIDRAAPPPELLPPELPRAPWSERILRLALLAHAVALLGATAPALVAHGHLVAPEPLDTLGSPGVFRVIALGALGSFVPIAAASVWLARRLDGGPFAAPSCALTIAAAGIWAGALGAFVGLAGSVDDEVPITLGLAILVLPLLFGAASGATLPPARRTTGLVALLALEVSAIVPLGATVADLVVNPEAETELLFAWLVVSIPVGVATFAATLTRWSVDRSRAGLS